MRSQMIYYSVFHGYASPRATSIWFRSFASTILLPSLVLRSSKRDVSVFPRVGGPATLVTISKVLHTRRHGQMPSVGGHAAMLCQFAYAGIQSASQSLIRLT